MGNTTPDLLATAGICAVGWISCPLSDIERLRTNPTPSGSAPPQLAKTLRNADEQTVASYVAIMRAIDSAGMIGQSFADWGVVSSPRFLGRMTIAASLIRYFGDPKYSVSPHIIPNYSLHSPSGAVSVALGMHGPNFGVGGGPDNASEGLVAALSVLADERIPGLWLLLSEFNPEPIPDTKGIPTNAVHVHAVALALQRPDSERGTIHLNRAAVSSPVLSVRSLSEHLAAGHSKPWICGVTGLGNVSVTIAPSAPESPNRAS